MSAQDYADKYGGTATRYRELVEQESCTVLNYEQELGSIYGHSEDLAVAKRMEELDC